MKILINNQIDSNVWNSYVKNNTFYRFEWLDIIQNTYNLEPYYLILNDGDKFALLPAFKVKNKLISLPYTYIVGFLSNSEELLNKLKEYINKNSLIVQYKYLSNTIKDTSTVTAIIYADSSDLFWKKISSNMRNQIRKSQQYKLVLKKEESVNNFYDIYSKKMHTLGTPIHSKHFFKNILKSIKNSYVFTVLYEEKAVASMFCIITNDITTNQKALNITWAATDSSYDKYYTNYFLYYEVIKKFIDEGISSIDLGTCKVDSSQYKFKNKWKPTFYSIEQYNGKDYKNNKKMILISNLWKKLPLSVANYLGPKLRKYLV
ncbi:GNAT family N-acetyltransferase [Aliarcobacter cryaerophilus]|uniref:GNAT family N-acetyltransferase n=1 Tax=Aliarcobacter cryaerophilus TaxID=28198 RepID=UPI0021B69170|nr:GNAT family N-acetyltransferase [Aliarcobacter cryaerophilus]MCT7528524.1 GNAT family N-acetyltransferase [Aliarcobacter cryaerophilus]